MPDCCRRGSIPRRDEVNAALAAGRLAHGLLIHEDPGAGGLEFARWIAQRVNCSEPTRAPCGECQECRWVAADQHPDVKRLSPEEDSTQILIEPGARAVCRARADRAWPWLQGRDRLSRRSDESFAANALLKTLEEPPARTLVLLVTSQPSRLLAHVAQPMLAVAARRPEREAAAAYLEAARGAGPWAEALAATGAGPFALLDADPAALAQLRTDTITTLRDIGSGNLQPPAVAEHWAKSDLAIRLSCLESWVTDTHPRIRVNPRRNALVRGGHCTQDMSPIRVLGRHSRHAQACPHIDQQDHGRGSAAVALGAAMSEPE